MSVQHIYINHDRRRQKKSRVNTCSVYDVAREQSRLATKGHTTFQVCVSPADVNNKVIICSRFAIQLVQNISARPTASSIEAHTSVPYFDLAHKNTSNDHLSDCFVERTASRLTIMQHSIRQT